MVIGVCCLTLALPGNDSLKGKRSVIRRVLDRTRNKFNVAAAEVDELDSHRRAVLGFSVVSNDTGHAQSMLDKLVGFIDSMGLAVLVGRTSELIHVGREHGGLS